MDYKVLTGKLERLNRLMNLRFASFFEDLPLTSTRALALEFVIQKASDGKVYQKDLESFLSIRGPSVTSLINNLERDGYIRRESVKFDGRYKHLAPTEKALAIQAEISQRIDRYMDSLFVGVPEADLKVYESVLDQMTQNVR